MQDGGKAMSVRKLTASMLTALALVFGVASVGAQEHVPPADPFAFDPDFQWFEPIYNMDLAGMKAKKRANYGWFATYDRLNLYGSRPETDEPNASETKLDSGWGHRYEIGYMLPDKDTGWLFSAIDTGVGEFFTIERERVNRINLDALTGDGQVGPPFGLTVPAADGNTPGLNTRTLFVQDSENVFSFDSYELSKTWRLEPYHYGGILEPMLGVRWMRLNDLNTRQDYSSSLDQDTVPFDFDGTGVDGERLITDHTLTENEILTGQVGFRYTKFRDRFTYAGEFRVFTGGSYQSSTSTETTEITLYDGAGAGADVTNIINRQTTPIHTRNEEFMLGFDVRGELNYQLTKAITLRGGFQLIDLARGVWRGGSKDPSRNQLLGGDSDQDVVMLGGTFGITLNR